MNNELIIANQLTALLASPVALLVSLFLRDDRKGKLIIFGQVTGLLFAAFTAIAVFASGVAKEPLATSWLALRVDTATCCLLLGVTFISAVVITFSDRYMLGESTRLNFMRALSIIASSAALLTVTDSMIVAFLCWQALSLGLWFAIKLRPENKKSANTVLKHHMVSDALFFIAITLCISLTGVTRFSDLSANLKVLELGPLASLDLTSGALVTALLIIAFGVKSALFPFHRWLLATLDAPTPLSGLLHAGVVNVSAIMAWRMMPLMQEHSAVLLAWGVWSGVSAIVGTLSMSAQPDVKRKLAYSTVGQMGFMSLQCATGAVAAALFHLVAHGLFKCHLFLQSGSAVSEGLLKRKFNYANQSSGIAQSIVSLVFIALATVVLCYLTVNPDHSTWTVMSALIASAALVSFIPALNRIEAPMLLLFWVSLTALAIPSLVATAGLEEFIKTEQATNAWLIPAFLITFAAIALAQQLARNSKLSRAMYVHSLNGFYADELATLFGNRNKK